MKKIIIVLFILLLPTIAFSKFTDKKVIACSKQKNYFPCMEKLANTNNIQAQYVLGLMYEFGKGVKQDYKKALDWYTKPAKQGNAQAQLVLGYMYENGKGTKQDHKKAVDWYTKSANQGNANAQFNLGVMYENGQSVKRDYKKAYAWYSIAVYNGSSDQNLKMIEKHMSNADINQAQDLAKQIRKTIHNPK